MSELRLNLITGEWVIIATERAKRPEEFKQTGAKRVLPPFSENCPFCPGHEDRTPPETLRIPDDGRWLVRAVPNKFSALTPEGDPTRYDAGLKTRLAGIGRHEVVIESPAHDATTALLPVEQVERVLGACRDRLRAFYREPSVEHVIIFKNHGEAAGTSLEHPHCQIVGTPVLPGQLRRRIEEAMRFWGDFASCLYCRTLADELSERVRVVTENASFVAFIPYAALSPFHLWITPRRHCANFGAVGDSELADLAAILRDVLRRLHVGLGDPDFNWVIRSLSPEESAVKYFHWYLSLVPRVSRAAGFELGTGMFINTALPETSAAFLRSVSVGADQTLTG
jgi:UDPglucose--hexose-1-phosphate uridylyltransferase